MNVALSIAAEKRLMPRKTSEVSSNYDSDGATVSIRIGQVLVIKLSKTSARCVMQAHTIRWIYVIARYLIDSD